ncbi:glycosyltransferase [Sphingomonas sp. PP-CC-1A-547]|uniref:glycosyltransferase n=1 Tax=unclassified Sphingomonas TaxID=196159 RepID=UPI000E709980|nr:glycosyltransferase [Sphingomonas sp. PP-CC-1A-547]
MINSETVFILCNALADDVRLERGIKTDSPAATRKVLMMARVLRLAGVRTTVLSLGRGRQDGTGRYFAPRVSRSQKVPILYGPLIHRPILSELLSFWAAIPLVWARRHRARSTVILIYNRMPAYLPAIWIARLIGYRLVLDLEDGETELQGWSPSAIKARCLTALTDRACTNGALLACRRLSRATHLQPQQAYYGVVGSTPQSRRFNGPVIHLLLGGTVSPSTGATLLVDAINILRSQNELWSKRLHFHITGTGESLIDFTHLAASCNQGPVVTVYGRLDNPGYEALLGQMDVGLALKPNSGPLADTTFPSKVIEMAGDGLLVLTTDISDVRSILGNAAVYLERDDPRLLTERLRAIVDDTVKAAKIAEVGRTSVSSICSPVEAGTALRKFLFTGAI